MRVVVRAVHGLSLTLTCLIGALSDCGEAWAQAPPPSPTSAALLSATPDALARWLEHARPAPLSDERRRRLLAMLPRDGEITALAPREAVKRRAIVALLEATGRGDAHAVKVVDLPQPAVAVYPHVVVLVTRPALDLLTADELVAVVAHELGHEYVWDDWAGARARGDRHRLQDLELVADIIGAATLHALGHRLSALVSGLDTLTRANGDRVGNSNPDEYPSLSRRRHVIRAVDRLLAAR